MPPPAMVSEPRRAAFEVVRRAFEHGAWADRALDAAVRRRNLDRRGRAQAQRLAYGAVQRRGTSDHLVARLGGRPTAKLDPPVIAALRLGLYEILHSSGTPDYAAVDQAVELAKGGLSAAGAPRGRARGAAGFVNAVLRRAVREAPAILAELDPATPAGAAVLHSVPLWLAELWFTELGAAGARALLEAMNEPAETALRVNEARAEPAALAAELRDEGASFDGPFTGEDPLRSRAAIVASGPLSEALTSRIESGVLAPQSRGSQAVVELLDPRPGERVLDLCAGPGIKTAAIAARLGGAGELVAVESDPGRARQIAERCGLAGVRGVRVVDADAAEADLGSGYDRVLVDPPCSDLGTLASRPDARWRKSPATIARLAVLQARIAARALEALSEGGTLVYSTCTISRAENEGVAAALAEQRGAVADRLGERFPGLSSSHDRRFLQLRPDRDRTDGFFIARLRKA